MVNIIAGASLLPEGAATSANQTNKAQYTRLTDGTDDCAVETLSDQTHDIDGLKGLVTASAIYGRIDDDTVKPFAMDGSTHAIETIGYEHHEIHSGSHYFVTGYQDLSINNVLDFTFQMPDTTKWIHWTWKISTESETLWQIYETAVATNPLANAVTPRNSNRNSGNTSGTTMKFELQTNLAGANADTNVTGATLIASSISGAGKESGMSNRTNELILKRNTLYCLRATATAADYISFDMEWYEHTDKD